MAGEDGTETPEPRSGRRLITRGVARNGSSVPGSRGGTKLRQSFSRVDIPSPSKVGFLNLDIINVVMNMIQIYNIHGKI